MSLLHFGYFGIVNSLSVVDDVALPWFSSYVLVSSLFLLTNVVPNCYDQSKNSCYIKHVMHQLEALPLCAHQ